MEEKVINLELTKDKAFAFYIKAMNVFFDFSKRELQVLTELLLLENSYKSYSEPVKWKMVFDKDNKKNIASKIGISSHQFNNILSKFRKTGVIKDNQIKKGILVKPGNGIKINFNVKIK